jgi:uncharacterized RmlC-like cupin family protein
MSRVEDVRLGCVVHGTGQSYRSQQGSAYAGAISRETVGSRRIWLGRVTIPAGGRTKAHVHQLHESAFYLLEGREVELWTGAELEHREVANAGDYLYIPANVAHVAVNRGDIDAVFIGVRDEATAQESVLMHPELDSKVP